MVEWGWATSLMVEPLAEMLLDLGSTPKWSTSDNMKTRTKCLLVQGDTLMDVPKESLVLWIRECNKKLREIHGIIDVVEQRCLAADGPVTKTHDEITDEELRRNYKLSDV